MENQFLQKSKGSFTQTLRRQLWRCPPLLWGNGLIIAFFLLLTFYVKFGGSDGEGWRRAEIVVRLFSEPFYRDHPFFGSLTKLSELLWCLSASLCFFSWSLIQPIAGHHHIKRFLWASAFVILLLLLDDIFRFTLIANLFLGIPKQLSYSFYGFVAIVYTVSFWRMILKTPYLFLIIALAMFAISGITDLLPIEGMGTPVLLEDGTKLLGLTNIALYFWFFCRVQVRRMTQIGPQQA